MNRPERKRKRKAPSSASSESSSKSASEESQKVSDEGPCWGCHTSNTPGDECVYEYCCLHTTHCGNWAHEDCCTAEYLYSGEELEACSDCDGETHKYLCPACYESWNDQGSRDVHVRVFYETMTANASRMPQFVENRVAGAFTFQVDFTVSIPAFRKKIVEEMKGKWPESAVDPDIEGLFYLRRNPKFKTSLLMSDDEHLFHSIQDKSEPSGYGLSRQLDVLVLLTFKPKTSKPPPSETQEQTDVFTVVAWHGIYSDSDKHDKLGPFPKGTLSSGSTFKVENTANKNVLRYKLLEQYLRANKHFVHGSKAGVYYKTGSCWQKIESSSHIFQDLDAGNKIWKKKTKGQYVANMALSASAKRLDDMASTIQFLQSQNFASPIDQESAPAAKVETKKSKKSAKKSAQSEVWDKVVELYNDPNWFLHHGLDQAMLACVVTCYTQNKIRTAYILDPNFVKFQEPDDWPHDQAFEKIAGKVPCKGQFRPQDKGRFPPPNITKRRDDVSASSKVADGLVRISQSISSLTNAQAGQSLGPQISVSPEEKQAKYLNALTALQLDPGATEAVQMQLAELIKIMQNTTKMALVGSWLVTATRMSKFNLEEMDMDSPEFGNFKNYFYGLWRVNAGAVGVGPPTFD